MDEYDASLIAVGADIRDSDILLNQSSSISGALSKISSRYMANYNEANGGREFRGQIHHLIPFNVMAGLSSGLQLRIVESGWNLDRASNLILLPSDLATYESLGGELPMHSGSHGTFYDPAVRAALSGLEGSYDQLSNTQVLNYVTSVEAQFREAILSGVYNPRVS